MKNFAFFAIGAMVLVGCGGNENCSEENHSMEIAEALVRECGNGACGSAPRLPGSDPRVDASIYTVRECAANAEYQALVQTDEYNAYVFRCEFENLTGEFAVKYFHDNEFFSECLQIDYAFTLRESAGEVGSLTIPT